MTPDERLALIRRKVEWANTHFKNLEITKNRFIESEPYTIGSEPDPKVGHEGLHRFFPTSVKEVDPDIALIAGDVLHNLRSALDHLASHLVDVAGGDTGNPDIMFPIFRGDKFDEASFGRKVKGMRDSAKDKIKKTEPYKNGQGHHLWVLHKLDIADKHHGLLTTLTRPSGFVIPAKGTITNVYWPLFAAPNFGEPLEVGKPFFTCHREEYKNMKISFEIAVSEPDVIKPKPIIWAMKYLIDKVDSLILDFKSELA